MRRGLWIREHLLGQPVPQVPVGVVIVLPDDPTQTLRQRMQITKDQACWKCHQKIDDLGFPFEAFDHFGRPRDSEIAVDNAAIAENQANASRQYAKGEKRPEKIPEYHKLPFDSTGMIYASGDPKLDGPVENAQEMIRRLADSERVRQVFIRYVFRYFMGRNETLGDAATLQEADHVYVESGGSFKELVVSLLTSESFLYRTVPVQPDEQAANSPYKTRTLTRSIRMNIIDRRSLLKGVTLGAGAVVLQPVLRSLAAEAAGEAGAAANRLLHRRQRHEPRPHPAARDWNVRRKGATS